jgi:hypothetical protein
VPPPPEQKPQVASFTLIDADTNQAIEQLADGAVIILGALPTRNLNIRADTDPETVGSVRFGLNNNPNHRIENGAPYALAGDVIKDGQPDYHAWTPAPGSYTLTATPHAEQGGRGEAGLPLTITFQVEERLVGQAPRRSEPWRIDPSFKSEFKNGRWHHTSTRLPELASHRPAQVASSGTSNGKMPPQAQRWWEAAMWQLFSEKDAHPWHQFTALDLRDAHSANQVRAGKALISYALSMIRLFWRTGDERIVLHADRLLQAIRPTMQTFTAAGKSYLGWANSSHHNPPNRTSLDECHVIGSIALLTRLLAENPQVKLPAYERTSSELHPTLAANADPKTRLMPKAERTVADRIEFWTHWHLHHCNAYWGARRNQGLTGDFVSHIVIHSQIGAMVAHYCWRRIAELIPDLALHSRFPQGGAGTGRLAQVSHEQLASLSRQCFEACAKRLASEWKFVDKYPDTRSQETGSGTGGKPIPHGKPLLWNQLIPNQDGWTRHMTTVNYCDFTLAAILFFHEEGVAPFSKPDFPAGIVAATRLYLRTDLGEYRAGGNYITFDIGGGEGKQPIGMDWRPVLGRDYLPPTAGPDITSIGGFPMPVGNFLRGQLSLAAAYDASEWMVERVIKLLEVKSPNGNVERPRTLIAPVALFEHYLRKAAS